jgi:HSP20 family protein
VAQIPFPSISESRELAEDVRTLFEELAASLSHEQRAYSGESHPVLDVYETDSAIEVIVDVSGVPAEAIRILFRDGIVLIAGEKAPPPTSPAQTFHLVEREFGRFARAVRVNGAFDLSQAKATLREGELTVELPKRVERRGQAHRIQVGDGTDRPA